MNRTVHTIDLEGKVLGRVSSEIAQLLRGKHKRDFQPHIDGGDIVHVKNANKIAVTGKKRENKMYYRHSEYPGGLKSENMAQLLVRKPNEVVRLAVYNMLPKNKLRKEMMKRLRFDK